MAQNCIRYLLAAAMLLCTLSAANAQQGAQQSVQQPRPNIGDQIPHGWGGLPDDAPARPQTVLPTPPVHDVPPPRATRLLDGSQQLKLEQELAAARARNQKLEDPNVEKKSEAAEAAAASAIKRARKKAGNPQPKASAQ
jgi:hypothetical protein